MNIVLDYYDSQMIHRDECGPNFLTFVLQLRKNPRKLTQPRIEPGPAAWEAMMIPLHYSSGKFLYEMELTDFMRVMWAVWNALIHPPIPKYTITFILKCCKYITKSCRIFHDSNVLYVVSTKQNKASSEIIANRNKIFGKIIFSNLKYSTYLNFSCI